MAMAMIRLKSMPNDHGRAHRRDHHQRQHDDRERQQDVDEALDPVVDLAAEIGRGHAEDRADASSHERRGEADHQRGARAVDDAREDVAAVGVGAAPMLPRRRLQDRGEVDVERVVGRHPSEKMPANIITKMMTKLTAPSGCCRQKSMTACAAADWRRDAGSAGEAIVIAVSRTGCADRTPRRAGRSPGW